jgi:glycerophosphoryl diester phosphodiesterase
MRHDKSKVHIYNCEGTSFWRRLGSPFFALLITLVFIYGASGSYALEPLAPKATMAKSVKASNSKHVMLIAHRGSPQVTSEHSIKGYKLAVNQGAAYIEQDIFISKDGVLFVSHDDNLKKSTGKNIKITKSKAVRLDRVKLKNGEKLPRLTEVFDEFGDSVFYVIETKKVTGKQARKMDRALIKAIKKYGLERRVMLQSQSVDSLKVIHKSLKQVSIMYIYGATSKKGLSSWIKSAPRWTDVVSVPYKKATAKIIKTARARNYKVALYTAKTKKDMKKFLKLRPDMVFTDNVRMSIKYISL